MIFPKKKIIYFLFLFFIANSNTYAIDNVCPGEPQTLYWGSINISTAGTCSAAASIPACSFSVSKNGTSSSVITTSNSCSVSLTCDGITANDSLNVNPNQSRCCGNWDLVGTVWNAGLGTCGPPAPTGTLTSSADSCSIATGASTCSVDLTWTTTNPITTSAITTSIPAPNTVLYSTNDGGPSPVSVRGPTSQTFYLYNNSLPIAEKTITTECAAGPTKWDTLGNVCADPLVDVLATRILNQNYPPGSIRLTCLNSTKYSITTDNPVVGTVVVAPGTDYNGPVTLNTPAPYGSNYVMTCTHGSVSDSRTIPYDSVAPPTTMVVNPGITVVTDPPAEVPITWIIGYPDNTCKLTAKVVCANNACSAAQLANETALNNQLGGAATTDASDPNTSRLMTTALRTPAPGHKDSDTPVIIADYKALGKKTLQITNTTDLTLDCNGSKITKRIRVTKNEEQ